MPDRAVCINRTEVRPSLIYCQIAGSLNEPTQCKPVIVQFEPAHFHLLVV